MSQAAAATMWRRLPRRHNVQSRGPCVRAAAKRPGAACKGPGGWATGPRAAQRRRLWRGHVGKQGGGSMLKCKGHARARLFRNELRSTIATRKRTLGKQLGNSAKRCFNLSLGVKSRQRERGSATACRAASSRQARLNIRFRRENVCSLGGRVAGQKVSLRKAGRLLPEFWWRGAIQKFRIRSVLTSCGLEVSSSVDLSLCSKLNGSKRKMFGSGYKIFGLEVGASWVRRNASSLEANARWLEASARCLEAGAGSLTSQLRVCVERL